MIKAEKDGIDFIALDQDPNRAVWQVPYLDAEGKPHTYCADFYEVATNSVIEIKTLWKQKIQQYKLDKGRRGYKDRGYIFKVVDAETIAISKTQLKKLVASGEIQLHSHAAGMFEKRFGFKPAKIIQSK